MGFLDRKTKVEIIPISGVLRVTVASEPNFLAAAVEVVSGAVFFWFAVRSVLQLPRIWQGLIVLGAASTVVGIRMTELERLATHDLRDDYPASDAL